MDELIKRQELSDEIQRIYDKHYTEANSQTVHDIFHAVLKRIDKAKAVDAAPIVHGHWVTNIYDRDFVRIDKDGFPEKSCYCSVCGDWLTASDEYAVRGYYCPNCGAKMDEKEN